MLSNPLHRFSPYNTSTTHVAAAHMHTAGMDTRAHGAHYTLALQHAGAPYAQNNHQAKHRQGAYGARTTTAGPVRRRISRACDQCNQLRTKCDGQHPCAHCIELGLGCEYVRARKKRGKVSRKDLAQQAAQAATQGRGGGSAHTHANGDADDDHVDGKPGIAASIGSTDGSDSDKTMHELVDDALHRSQRTGSLDSLGDIRDLGQQHHYLDLNGYDAAVLHNPYDRAHHILGAAPHTPFPSSYPDLPYGTLPAHSPTGYASSGGAFRITTSPMTAYHAISGAGEPVSPPWMSSPPPQHQEQQSSLQPPQPPQPPQYHNPQNMSAAAAAAAAAAHMHSFNGIALHNLHPAMHPALTGDSLSARASASTSTSRGTASAATAAAPPPHNTAAALLRYPVLAPLAPYLAAIMPLPLACDLVDLYFSSASAAQMHPVSPYVLCALFRKRSFLHATAPRPCQPALLASMLWVAAQTSDAPLIASVPAARGAICQKLLELTVGLLKPLVPLVHNNTRRAQRPHDSGGARAGAAGTIDDVVTYVHLATVVSASEYKGASLRWWNAAWCLARELRLGREVPGDGDLDLDLDLHTVTSHMPDEAREERRRIWWLLYMVDRHLALCYNRPLFLLDVECDGLRRPMDDTAWQAGDFGRSTSSRAAATTPDTSRSDGVLSGPSYACSSHSIFGYFLPLMTILGEIVDLHHARNHPRFGLGCGFRSSHEWDAQTAAITHHLAVYEQSLKAFEQRTLSPAALIASNEVSAAAAAAAAAATTDASNHAAGVDGQQSRAASAPHNATPAHAMPMMPMPALPDVPPLPRMTELDIQTRTVAAYGTHVLHVLHILLAGKWDPVNLLDDNDLWISSQGFITATGHAVAAAEAISEILEYDPGLERMPFFFGIYLLQGSFLLLLIADKLQLEASNSVVRACETIIRAHEACVVTLSTEYQRNFSRVMRSALAQARGRVPEDLGEQHMRRRELLSLYRWTGDGTGLAL